MSDPAAKPSAASRVYVGLVITAGAAVLALSVFRLFQHPPRFDFYSLAALTLISGLLPLKLPNVSANISVSETFVFAGTPCWVRRPARCSWAWTRPHLGAAGPRARPAGLKWRRMLFSLTAPALSIGRPATCCSGSSTPCRSPSSARRAPTSGRLRRRDRVHRGLLLLNTLLVAFAIGLERAFAAQVWRKNFSSLWLILAGASIAMLLVSRQNGITWAFVLVSSRCCSCFS